LRVTSHDSTRYKFSTPFCWGYVVWDVAVSVGCFTTLWNLLIFFWISGSN
jgi:hypothetical protein